MKTSRTGTLTLAMMYIIPVASFAIFPGAAALIETIVQAVKGNPFSMDDLMGKATLFMWGLAGVLSTFDTLEFVNLPRLKSRASQRR